MDGLSGIQLYTLTNNTAWHEEWIQIMRVNPVLFSYLWLTESYQYGWWVEFHNECIKRKK